jgi:hypothetical protein
MSRLVAVCLFVASGLAVLMPAGLPAEVDRVQAVENWLALTVVEVEPEAALVPARADTHPTAALSRIDKLRLAAALVLVAGAAVGSRGRRLWRERLAPTPRFDAGLAHPCRAPPRLLVTV